MPDTQHLAVLSKMLKCSKDRGAQAQRECNIVSKEHPFFHRGVEFLICVIPCIIIFITKYPVLKTHPRGDLKKSQLRECECDRHIVLSAPSECVERMTKA